MNPSGGNYQQGYNQQQGQGQYGYGQQQQQQQQQYGGGYQNQPGSQQHNGNYDANGLAAQFQNQHLGGGSDYVVFDRNTENFSQITKERAAATKLKVELLYNQNVQHAVERNQRRVELEQRLNAETRMSEERKNRSRQQLGAQESNFLRLRRTRLTPNDFLTVKVIGKGAFGEVRLVQKKDTGKIYAMKTLLKTEMLRRDQLAHVKAERDVLAEADSPWVVNLHCSFQDQIYLYLIMEFLPGGDLMTMLIRYEIFPEDVTKFYMAECVLAIEAVHKLGFIHRDIKPDNILIDKEGHVKLSDFGLSTGFHKTHDQTYYNQLMEGKNASKPAQTRNSVMVDAIHLTMSDRNQMNTLRKNRRLMAYSTVGTPDYIAPEIFEQKGYGMECDWWSLGTIMFECLVGWPPFCGEDNHDTYRKIMHWRETLFFPEEIQLSRNAEDLIRCLITSADQRLGRNGADEIKAHPFFAGVDWNTLRDIEAPFKPQLQSITDTSYFPTDELENVPDAPAVAAMMAQQQSNAAGLPEPQAGDSGLPFIGYTYKRFDALTKAPGM